MVLEKVIEQVGQVHFRDQMENHTHHLLKRLKDIVEARRPLVMNWSGTDHYAGVIEMEDLGWVKTRKGRSNELEDRTYYEPTSEGTGLYQQLVQEGYTFPG